MAGFGGAVKLTGETEYRRALQQINQSLRETSSEMKAVASSYSANDRSQTATTAKAEVLNRKLQEQEQKLSVLKNQYSNMSAVYSQQTAKHEALVAEYNKEKEKLETIGKELGTTSQEYKDQEAKVAGLQQEVVKSTKAQDDNEKSMSKMRTQINLAQADINKTTQELDGLGKEAEESGKQAENAGGGFTIFKGIVANLASQAIMSAINGLRNLGRALIDVGKQALSNYANYEQLVGGVETLFGKSAPIVQKYAREAFKTAGLSSNEYMETVTSFSASLINSLGGDTAKASEVANRAIKDMSDNANKMGTDMGSIQNAYQGFAKQNYTMLDNLKLGYGGTKTEMQRLISDASKMNSIQKELGITVKDGDMSFANIANAISVVQKKMGIMGTTAKEADTTIEGSVNSMKASWQNLLTGMADNNADLKALSKDFADTVVTALSNILPKIVPIIEGLGTVAKEAFTKLLPRIVNDVIPMIQPAVMQLVQSIPPMLENLSAKFSEFAPKIAQYGADLLLKLGAGFIKALPTLMSTLGNIINGLLKVFIGLPAILLARGFSAIGKFALGLLKGINNVINAGLKIVGSVLKAIASFPTQLFHLAVNAVRRMASGIASGASAVVSRAKAIAHNAIQAVRNGFSNIGNVGLNLVRGIWNGISNGTAWIKGRIRSWVGNITNFLKNLFGIHSPSTLYRDEIGVNLAKGIGVGFTNEMQNVEREMGDAIPKSFDNRTVAGARYSSSDINADSNMVFAFKQALSEMKIVLDDEVAGAFVDRTVTRAIYG